MIKIPLEVYSYGQDKYVRVFQSYLIVTNPLSVYNLEHSSKLVIARHFPHLGEVFLIVVPSRYACGNEVPESFLVTDHLLLTAPSSEKPGMVYV